MLQRKWEWDAEQEGCKMGERTVQKKETEETELINGKVRKKEKQNGAKWEGLLSQQPFLIYRSQPSIV